MTLQAWQYALLSETVYRRAPDDFNLQVADIPGVNAFVVTDENTSTLADAGIVIGRLGTGEGVSNQGFFINPNNGLTALVTEGGGGYQITFRGTDTAGPFSLIGSAINTAFSGTGLIGGAGQDEGDLLSNRQLARGQVDLADVEDHNQWQTAKVLVEFVIKELAGGDSSKVSVAGQSLGGGLAGLAAATYGLDGTIFGPAPFARQLEIESFYSALRELNGETQNLIGGSRHAAIIEEVRSLYKQFFTEEFRLLSVVEQVEKTELIVANDDFSGTPLALIPGLGFLAQDTIGFRSSLSTGLPSDFITRELGLGITNQGVTSDDYFAFVEAFRGGPRFWTSLQPC